MKINKPLIYGALGVITLGALIYLMSRPEEEKKEDTKAEDEGQTENEQKVIDPNLEKAKDAKGKLTSIVGKDVYTKVEDVNIRNTPEVNNGLLNNIYGVLPAKGLLIGKVTSVVKKGNLNWVGVKLSKSAYDIIQSEKNLLTRDIWVNIPPLKWVREDVIKLN